MAATYDHHTPEFKQRVLAHYEPGVRGSGFAALAKRFDLSCPRLVRDWWNKYDGTKRSLAKATTPNRKRKLTAEESEKHIKKFVIKKNKAGESVDYGAVQREVKRGTGKDVHVRTLRRYGQEDHGLSFKKTTRKLHAEGTNQATLLLCSQQEFNSHGYGVGAIEGKLYWDAVAQTRKRLQRSAMGRLVFIDQSRINLNPGPNMGLAPLGAPAVIKAPKPAHWEPRIDFMGACSGSQLLALETKSATERKEEKVKGWRKNHVLAFVRDQLAPAITAAHLSGVTVVLDRALRIRPDDVTAALVAGGVHDAKEALVLPAGTAKYISPLDNTLWHEMKQRIRARAITTEDEAVAAIREEWEAVSVSHLRNYYHHCALTARTDPQKGRA